MDPDIAPDSQGGCTGHDPVLAPGSPAARKRKPRRLREEGAVGVAIMISDTLGLWHADMIRSAAARPRGTKSATGVLWPRIDQVTLDINRRWQERGTWLARVGASSIARRYSLSGFVEYLCLATAVLLSPVHHGIMDPRALLKILEPFEVELPPVEDGAPERVSVRTLITRWRHQCEVDILPVDCLMITPLLVGPILSGKASICHVVGQRVCRKRLTARPHGTNKWNAQNASEREREFVAATEVPKGRRHVCEDVTGATCMTLESSSIGWLRRSTSKNINQAWFTARAFARIFAKHRQCDVSEVVGSTRRVPL